ncbi:4-dihydromethyltrisporate dehydrogenase [Backusella circina FSU 941]|nr:4-dihydromethyltrisporate dehydrogenase [Backusella circina FSU 941]
MGSQSYITLTRTGDKMPLAGFGTARIPAEETAEVVYNAVKAGYRLIDGALFYDNEAQVGEGVRRAIAEGIVERKDLFIVGKLWNHYHGKDHVRYAFDLTLNNYGLEYIDLYLAHYPFATEFVPYEELSKAGFFNTTNKKELSFARAPMYQCWAEMEKLVDAGLVRNIGISNFNVQTILDLLTYCKYKPATLEIEYHPYLQQRRLVDWIRKQDIHTIAYASFGPTAFSVVPEKIAHFPSLLKHPVAEKIAEKHSISAGQVVLKWAVQHEVVVIPKSVNVERMKTNLDLYSFTLDEEDMKAMDDLEANARFNDLNLAAYGFELPMFD